jgi:Uma2 family endonuclease
MRIQEQLYTNEEFWEFVNRPENEYRRFELYNGVIYEVPSATPLHGLIMVQIMVIIANFVNAHQLGYVFGDANDFVLAPNVIFQPDLAFIAKSRLSKLPQKHFEIAPDLAVEVISPSNLPGGIANKVETYVRYGTRLVWLVYPEERVVRIYRPAGDGSLNVRKLTEVEILDGGEVLPEFSVVGRDLIPAIEVDGEE